MAKKAFIIGKNTKSLRWSERDAELMNEALSIRGYEITKVEPTNNKYKIMIIFDDFIDEIAHTDTVIFYFSGHAYTPKGELELVIDDNLQSSKSTLDASYFTDAFTKSNAETKLIILDCCRANTEGKNWKPEFGNEKYRLLTASESLSQSKEIDELAASLMTFFLHKSLTESANNIADEENNLRIGNIYNWIVAEIKEYDKARKLPLPSLLGDLKIDFSIATVKKTTKQREAQKDYLDRLWKKYDNLIYDCKYWDGKLIRAEKEGNNQAITEYSVKLNNLLTHIEKVKYEIRGWTAELQGGKIKEIELYENVELKLKDYTELPEPDNHFVGREELIKKVFNRLLSRKNIAVTGIKGMGGIGKTAITVEICNFIKESWEENPVYPEYLKEIMGLGKHFEHGILWVRFEKKEPLKILTHDKIAYQLGLKFTEDSDPKAILKKISTILKLKNYRNKVLIILDSAEQNETNFEIVFRAFIDLPVLVTTREKLDIDSININQLDIEDAINLFKNHYLNDENEELNNQQTEVIEAICNEVGYLPLAVKILAKRAKKYSSKSLSDILNEFREKKLEVLNAKMLTEKERKNEDAIICFKMSFDDETVDELTKNVFMRCGLFYLPFEKHKIASAYEDKDITTQLDELERISLIDLDKERKKYYLHPLMREFALKSAADSGVIEDLYKWHKNNFLDIDIMDIPNGKELFDTIEEIFKTIEYFAKQKENDAYDTVIEFTKKHHEKLFYKGFWERAINLIDYGINACVMLGENEKHGEFLEIKGDRVGRQGKYDSGRKYMSEALKIQNKENYFIYYSLIAKDYHINCIDKAFVDNFSYSRKADILKKEHVFSFLKTNGWIYKDFFNLRSEKLAIVNLKKEKGGDDAKNYEKGNFIKAISDLIDIKSVHGYYLNCVNYSLIVLEYSKKEQNSENISYILSQLVQNYILLKEFDNAKKYLSEYEKLIADMGLLYGFRTIHLYKGHLQYLQGNYETALSHFEHIEKEHEKNYWRGKTYLRISGEHEKAEKHLLSALNYHEKQKNAVNIAKVYTQLALLEYKKEDGKLIKSVEYLCLAINTKIHYQIIDFEEENEIRQVISQKDKSTYEFLEQNFKGKYIDVIPNFVINDLDRKIIIPLNNKTKTPAKEMVLIPEGISFVTDEDVDDIVIYEADFILKNISDFWNGIYQKRPQATEYYLYPFYIDKYPITNLEYKEFCIATNKEQPEYWTDKTQTEFWNKPITNIAYEDAEDFAKWSNKELPTQAEWEKALTDKNNPFLSSELDVKDNKVQMLQDIIKECSFIIGENNETFKALVGDNIYTHLKENTEKLKNWSSVNKTDIYSMGDFNEYSVSAYNNLLHDVPANIIEKINWKRLFTLIAFSYGTGGITTKSNILKKLATFSENKLHKLYTVLIDEAIKIYKISENEKTEILSDYLLEKNNWISAVKSFLGIDRNFESLNALSSEIIAGNQTINYSNGKVEVSNFEKPEMTIKQAFRCVKPIYSNQDYQEFIKS